VLFEKEDAPIDTLEAKLLCVTASMAVTCTRLVIDSLRDVTAGNRG
jgi:hypothetical protein